VIGWRGAFSGFRGTAALAGAWVAPEWSPALAAIVEEEIARGLARERRVAMVLDLPR
jgi:hypothetical protein